MRSRADVVFDPSPSRSLPAPTLKGETQGVYWIAVQEILEQAGIEVYLVNARGTQNLPGRKSDVQECQWLMKLHTYGLLRNSFRPPEEIRSVRTVWRLRDRLVKDAGRAIQQIQKALTVRRSLKSRQRDPSNGAIPSCVGRTNRASTWSLSYVACLG